MRQLWCAILGLLLSIPATHVRAVDPLGGASPPKPQMDLKNFGQYKRIHQYALRMLMLLRFDEAERVLNEHLEQHPRDPESHYLLAVSSARQNQVKRFEQLARKAIELGLPPQRVIAGPRGPLRSVRNLPFYKQLLDEFAHEPIHGPMLGNVTHDSASFWVRTSEAAKVEILASRSADLTDPVRSSPATSSNNSDFTTVARLHDLKPDTKYYYVVAVDGQHPARPGDHQQFRTFPSQGARCDFKLAFGGGAGYVPEHEHMWDTIRDCDPLAILLLGDNVYIDDPQSIIMQQYTYQRRQSREEFRRLTAQTAVFTIWDDHDFGTNDCWGGPLIETPFWKRNYAYRTFRQNWPNPGFGGGDEQPGCWYSFSIGDVDFIMLDCRYYRTSPRVENPSMLGPVQMKWLEQQLNMSTGTFKVLCSSVPWDFRTKGDSRDTWNGYQDEREAIFRHIERENIEGVVLMSADRHRSDAWRIERPDGYDFYEFNSSRLTNQHVHPTRVKQGAIFSYNAKQSFGLVHFDTVSARPKVTYEVVNIDGERVHELTIRRDQLVRQ